jgi:aryl-alcohol dehydrogenase-like predicted oxidoreductase
MEYRTLGKTEIKVPVVSFGAWAIGGSMWGGTDDEAAVRAIHKGIDLGITCIDTAAIYGMGHSERLVGAAVKGRRDQVVIATKCGLRWDLEEGQFFFEGKTPEGVPHKIYRNLRPESIRYECEQSLKRIGVDAIDLYQCHWPDPTSSLDDAMDTLFDLQKEGKIRAVGVSNFGLEMLDQCLKKGILASDQPKYNLLERDIEEEILPFCIEENVGVLAYSPMAMGLLTGKVTLDREFKGDDMRRNRPWFTRENRKRVLDLLAKIQPIADGHHATVGQVAVNWVISQKGITSALVGARNEAQVAENAKAADFRLSEQELRTVGHLVEELGGPI